MKIIEQIIRFEKHYTKVLELSVKDVSDYLIFTALAMECFQAINSLIEIAEYVLNKHKIGFPSTYRELFELLYKHGFIENKTFESIKKLIFYRNLIAHEYYKISEKELLEMVELLKETDYFVQKVKKEVKL